MGPDAVFMAGGTLVMRDVNAGTAASRIVRSADPALREIRATGDGFPTGDRHERRLPAPAASHHPCGDEFKSGRSPRKFGDRDPTVR
jgi:hypothetical protein